MSVKNSNFFFFAFTSFPKRYCSCLPIYSSHNGNILHFMMTGISIVVTLFCLFPFVLFLRCLFMHTKDILSNKIRELFLWVWGRNQDKEFLMVRAIPSYVRGVEIVPVLAPVMGNLSKCGTLYQSPPQRTLVLWGKLIPGESSSSMVPGQTQDQVLSTKNLFFLASWDPFLL